MDNFDQRMRSFFGIAEGENTDDIQFEIRGAPAIGMDGDGHLPLKIGFVSFRKTVSLSW